MPRAAEWSKIIDQHDASGLTAKKFAMKNGLNPGTLASWRWKLGRTRPKKRKTATNQFAEIAVVDSNPDGTVVVAVEELGAHIVVDEHTDLRLLKRVLEALC